MEHPAEHVPTIAGLLLPAINFGLFAFLLWRFLSGPIREFFRVRADLLRERLAAGDQARREAEALRARLATDLADLPALRERLKADLRETAERERDRLLTQAEQTAQRIAADARLLAEQEVAGALRALRAEVVADATRRAMDGVRAALQPQDQDRFVREFVASTGAAS